MLTYGVKINNYQAGSVMAAELGVRQQYDYKSAMLTNSLFTDFLLANGLNVYKETSTRDIIGVDFNYGTRSFGEEMKRLRRTYDGCAEDKKEFVAQLMAQAQANEHKFRKLSADEIRTIFYRDGVTIHYGNESIHYNMLFRTPGKAKKGSCMFVCDRLYDKAIDFLRMGLKLPEHNAPIVEMGAYSSLVTSSIVGRVKIVPENILVLKDVDSAFFTTAVSVEVDEYNHCVARTLDNYKIINTLFDGQALIDLSIFPEWGDGYVLLRHHFMKAAAFATDIGQFMRDWWGDDYESATVCDMWGNEHKVKDVQVITTENAMKWMKFDVSYESWCAKVHENGCMFGIVKTAHPSKLGDVQRMSYQMVNALDEETIDQVVRPSMDYVALLKTDLEVFKDYLRSNSNFSNDFDVLLALLDHNKYFYKTDYFRNRRYKIIESYMFNLKNGRLIQNADNLVIVGSPYAMLLHSVGADVNDDPTFGVENGCIQCCTQRFADGEYLAEFRNPFNNRSNLGYMHNVIHPLMLKYFRLGKLCVAVNMIHTDFQSRNNGSDQDSDSIYVTNQPNIVAHAKMCYRDYPTVVNNIPMEKNHYDNTPENFALIDNNLAAAQKAIGESSNLAQICLTYSYNDPNPKIKNYVDILAVIAQVSIDQAKRKYDIDIAQEIQLIKQDIDVVKNGYPLFWLVIRKGFNRQKINPRLRCPMNYIYNLRNNYVASPDTVIDFTDMFTDVAEELPTNVSRGVAHLIQKYSIQLGHYNINSETNNERYLLLRADFDELIETIRHTTLPNKYTGLMMALLRQCFDADVPDDYNLHKNRSLLLKTLYDVNKDAFLHCFIKIK